MKKIYSAYHLMMQLEMAEERIVVIALKHFLWVW